jgi:hypothetical protein
MGERPTITVLCGSTRFCDEFDRQNMLLTLAGHIVLTIGVNMRTPAGLSATLNIGVDEAKVRLDALHLAKIDLADEVFVLNVDGYIGESTRREIDYAESLGVPVRYLEPPTPEEPTEPGAYLIGDVAAMRWEDSVYAWSWQRSTDDGKAIIFRGTWGAVDGAPGANLVADLNLGPDVTIRRMVPEPDVSGDIWQVVHDVLTDEAIIDLDDRTDQILTRLALSGWGPPLDASGKPVGTISEWVNCDSDSGREWMRKQGWVPIEMAPEPEHLQRAHALVDAMPGLSYAADSTPRGLEPAPADRMDVIAKVLEQHPRGSVYANGLLRRWVCGWGAGFDDLPKGCGAGSIFDGRTGPDAHAGWRRHLAEQIHEALGAAVGPGECPDCAREAEHYSEEFGRDLMHIPHNCAVRQDLVGPHDRQPALLLNGGTGLYAAFVTWIRSMQERPTVDVDKWAGELIDIVTSSEWWLGAAEPPPTATEFLATPSGQQRLRGEGWVRVEPVKLPFTVRDFRVSPADRDGDVPIRFLGEGTEYLTRDEANQLAAAIAWAARSEDVAP